jgi:general secretion pathway protein A
MYKEKWGLREKPFQNVPDTRFLFYSSSHEEALVRMLYCVTESKGLMLLLGSWGVGKTFTCRVFREKVLSKGFQVAILHPPPTSVDDLLLQISDAYTLDHSPRGRFETYKVLTEHAGRLAAEGRSMVLILDEAQFIRDSVIFEEIRLLLNLTSGSRFLINVILAGVPELWHTVSRVEGLRQRVGITYRISPLSREETEDYIMHRLKISGLNHNIFLRDAMDLLWGESGGIPGQLNRLCDLSMLVATGEGKDEVDGETVQKAVGELAGSGVTDEKEGEI